MPLRPTLRDIARETGFSTSTVSAALNNDPRVKKKTRETIQSSAKRLGYTPDPALMALSAYRWNRKRNLAGMTIAYLVDEQSEDKLRKDSVLKESMKRRAEELGYHFYIHKLRELGSPESANRILSSRGTSGLIVGPMLDDAYLKGFNWNEFSAIAVDLGHVRPPLPIIASNPITCIRTAWEKTLASGRNRIGVVLAADHRSDFFNEQRAWALNLQEQLPPHAPKIPIHNFTTLKSMHEWIETHQPEVLIGYHEWLVDGLEELGYKIPDDLAFVSLRKQLRAYPDELLNPEITGVLSHPDQIGRMAIDQVDLLIRRNERGPSNLGFTVHVDLSWHEGNSLPKVAQDGGSAPTNLPATPTP